MLPTQRSFRQIAAMFAATTFVLAPQAAHLQATGDKTSVPTLKANARLTLVDVTVTDAKGRPVHGLTQADFTVKEDGAPQAIKNFEAFDADRPAERQPLPPDVYSNRPAAANRAVNVLLFDQVATGISRGLQPSPEALKYAKDAAKQFLTTMPAEMQVCVMAMDGSGLHLVQGFTSDRKRLLAAVDSIAYQLVPESYYGPWKVYVAMNFQSAQAINALNQMALFVSGVPGRKNLLWFTPGTPWLTGYLAFSGIQGSIDYTPQLQAVYGRLTSARVAVYAIDPRGLYGNPALDAGASGRAPRSVAGFSGSVFQDSGSLEDIAKATGGKAYFSRNDLGTALEDAAATGADYYALSYVPPLERYDGKYHKIEVTVDRPGVQLEYRRGYTSLDINGPLLEQEKVHGLSTPPKDTFQTAMSYGAPAATQVVFAVKAAPASGAQKPGVIGSLNAAMKGKPLVRYSFDFDLPRDKITLTQLQDGSRKATFELAVAAYDVQGRVLNALDEKRSFTLKADAVEDFLQRPFVVPVELDLPQGALTVRAGIQDLPTEEMGVVEIPLKVGQ